MPVDDALFAITGRSPGWTPPASAAGELLLAMETTLSGRFIYWCGSPVGKVEGRWHWDGSRLTVARIDADKAVAIVDGLPDTTTRPRPERCATAHADLGAVLVALPARLSADTIVAGYRICACGGGRAVLVATAAGARRFDDCQICVDAAGSLVQFSLTRATVGAKDLDADHLICFVTPPSKDADHAQR